MTATLAHVPWIKALETRAVMDALDQARDGASRFVGGCVRNGVLGLKADDIDIATQLTPPEVIAAVEAAGLKAFPTGIDHGTITVVADHKPFEITTLRRDVSTDGRRATVAFTTDWTEDAARRDFRLNALYADRDGVIFDPTGEGIADAKAGRIVFIGDAAQRLREDHLRILRFFRFSAWYGRGALDADGLAACAAQLESLADLSVERVWKELKKLVAAPDPRAALSAMTAAGIDPLVWPQASRLDRLHALINLEADAFLPGDGLQRIAAALPDAEAARALSAALKLANDERDRLVGAHTHGGRVVSFMSLLEVRRVLYRIGQEAFLDQVAMAWADDGREKTTPQWRALMALAQGWTRPTFPLTGAQVISAGVAPGPLVGEVMREVESWWIDADFISDPLSIAERLKAVVQGLT
ncbi:MAG: CCA tRNA nucleotidyltransferase [Caulobacterales bacterium]|jgi:poly(A) polymerase